MSIVRKEGMNMNRDLLRLISPVHELIQHERLSEKLKQYPLKHDYVKQFLNEATNNVRISILNDRVNFSDKAELNESIIDQTIELIEAFFKPKLRRVINGTGTILHTNLGRARLSESAINKIIEVSRYYSNLEYNIEKGTRGSRHDLVESYLTKLTGAEGALVVNNNAAAVYFILKAFANTKEVIVSRGELVEIGGSFRVSSIMSESGAILKEIGTTNKTHLYDYENAINEQTAMILKVHPSNFKMIGFTKSVSRDELINLTKSNNLLYYEDLGSGMMYDLRKSGIGNEPLVKEIIESDADLVSFSGDKLLGGPQVGIIVGKKKWIDQLKKHQLARVLRVDKMTYAALEETIKMYFYNSNYMLQQNPTLHSIHESINSVIMRVEQFVEKLPKYNHFKVEPIKMLSNIGGGSLPTETIESYGIKLVSTKSANRITNLLRNMEPPIITRIENDRVMIDFRTIHVDDIQILIEHFKSLDSSLVE